MHILLDKLQPSHTSFILLCIKSFYPPQERAKQGERTLSIDEMTGVQALERKAPDLPLAPGKVQRREFEYIRHGTQALIVNPEATGWYIVIDGLKTRLLEFIDYLNRTMAKPFK